LQTAQTIAYAAAKAAIGLLTKTAALECAAAGNGVRANTIYPGNVDTPFFAPVRDDPVLLQAALARIPLGRLGTSEAAAILFLASDESSFMTGADLVVDGGYTAQ